MATSSARARDFTYLDEEKEPVYTSRWHEKNCAYMPWDYAAARAL
ncbi:MAG TPA: hypothetical protein VFG22_03535 [Polyangiales bacterium]|nr:hypothetical protein [Polyangiales bacterium]